MARARTGGAGSAFAIALTIFGVGFFVTLLLAIIFFAQLGGARQERDDAQSELARFAPPAERARPELQPLLGQQGGAVGQLLEQNRQLKNIIANNPEITVEAIRTELNRLNVNAALLNEVQQVRANLTDAQNRLQAAEQARQREADRAEEALQARQTLAEQYTQNVRSLEGQISQLQEDLAAFQGVTGGLEQRMTQEHQEVRRQLTQRAAEVEAQLATANTEIERLRRIIADLTQAGDGAMARITTPDAQITGIIPGQDRVVLNRGQRHRVTLGLTFEVFDGGDLIRLEEAGAGPDIRGKATVEVIDVRDNSSLARVVRLERGRSISEGDDLINLVYDPYKTHKFYVYGDFDIDNRGEPQVQDRRRIEDMVRRWGGRVGDGLSYDVDFLVLGQEPPLPEPLPPGVIDPQRIAENVEAQRNFERYQELVGEAREMNIPILNQNRFLNLVGHFRR
jgi:predicted  nucleic acid-binding Zn-ribbon protein